MLRIRLDDHPTIGNQTPDATLTQWLGRHDEAGYRHDATGETRRGPSCIAVGRGDDFAGTEAAARCVYNETIRLASRRRRRRITRDQDSGRTRPLQQPLLQ